MSYDYPNAFFKKSDSKIDMMGGFEIPEGWWSRKWEYLFAMTHAAAGQVVADMGCGWHYRPLHDWLSAVCDFTYGVDHHPEVLELPAMQKGAFVVADFARPIEAIPAGSLDRIFCISVLEELINYPDALAEFKRLLKPTGRMVITMDVPHNPQKPAHEKYKGVNLAEFEAAMWDAGLAYDGSVCRVMPEDALHNDDFNLCVWHCVLKVRM
jgi:trans-aconitate methyltransferase